MFIVAGAVMVVVVVVGMWDGAWCRSFVRWFGCGEGCVGGVVWMWGRQEDSKTEKRKINSFPFFLFFLSISLSPST
jgi:hypothetical protein